MFHTKDATWTGGNRMSLVEWGGIRISKKEHKQAAGVNRIKNTQFIE